MFTLFDYIGIHRNSPDWTPERQHNAQLLIAASTLLQMRLQSDGVHFHTNPKTGTTISGETYGGFRPQDCPQGAPNSAHKEGLAVDRYDPFNEIDDWLLAHEEVLKELGIYIEHPTPSGTYRGTPYWSHWSIRAPGSKHHIFYP
jgi:hypothetical protein